MNNRLVMIGGAVVVAVLVIGTFMLVSNNSNQEDTPTPTITEEQNTQTSPTETEESSQATSVTLSASGFSPANITIAKGSKVVWTNESGETATVDSNPHPIHTSYQEMNLGNFGDGETLEFTFPESGTFNYHNHLNSSQGGSITVTE